MTIYIYEGDLTPEEIAEYIREGVNVVRLDDAADYWKQLARDERIAEYRADGWDDATAERLADGIWKRMKWDWGDLVDNGNSES